MKSAWLPHRDFTLTVYRHLLVAFENAGYDFFTLERFVTEDQGSSKKLVLRHDVDRKPANALRTAIIEKELNIKASYYFRMVRESYNRDIIKHIVTLGHEIGYHYEDLSLHCADYRAAIESFENNLRLLRKLYPVKTICMHGSPLSGWDNRDIWRKYNYRQYGIIAEPYFDIDYNKVFYVTDTGRKWNASKVSLRDKVDTVFKFNFNSTFDIIDQLNSGMLPGSIIQNTHPQRWNNSISSWIMELVGQTTRNVGKQALLVTRKTRCVL
jgi:hypothetical protein